LDKNNFHQYSTKAGNYSTRFGANQSADNHLSKRKNFFHFLEIKKVKFITKVLTGKEKLAVIFFFSIALMALIYLAIAWIGAHSVIIAQDGGDYIEGIVGSPGLINPIFSSNNETDQDITWLIFNGLLKNEDGKLVNDLAEHYTISDDGLSYTFSIRKDVVFHDGAPLTADDIIFTVETIQNSQTASALYKSLSGFKAEKKDDYTVVFTLNKPFAPFLSLLSFGIVPKHILESTPPQSMRLADFNIKTPIGTGPFQIKSFKKDNRGVIKSYTLARNEKYYTHPPYLSTITLKFFANIDAALDALRNKNIDGISYLPTKYQTDALKKIVDIRSLSLPQYTAIFFNQQKNPYLSNAAVRKALTLAINRDELAEKMGSQITIIYGPILAGFVGYHPDIKKYNFNPI
jgi:peptide/nickel transport system substrate-binding protein